MATKFPVKTYANIKKIAKERGISIMEIERRLGISRGGMCKWDENQPTIGRLAAVANLLGVPVSALIETADKVPDAEVR